MEDTDSCQRGGELGDWMKKGKGINKKTSKLVNFCVAILILKMEENKQHFEHIQER